MNLSFTGSLAEYQYKQICNYNVDNKGMALFSECCTEYDMYNINILITDINNL